MSEAIQHFDCADPPPDPQAMFYGCERGVRAARYWVAHLVEGRTRAVDMEAVAAELLANVVRHTVSAGGLFTVTVEAEADGTGIVVRDGGSREGSEPYVAVYDGADGCEHGHGMVLVNELADSWGTSAGPDGRDTWAWFARGSCRGLP